MFASAIPLALVAGWSIPISIVAMGIVTMVYTLFGGFKAVVWTDVLQLTVYLAGGSGRSRRLSLAGGLTWHSLAAHAGKLKVIDPALVHSHVHAAGWGIGGALLAALARHRPSHRAAPAGNPIAAGCSSRPGRLRGDGYPAVQPLPSRGVALWAAGLAPEGTPSDQLFPSFVVHHLPTGLAGLVVAGILAAAMGTHSSAINSLASSATHDLYASWTHRRDPVHLLRVGRVSSALWAAGLIAGALCFHYAATGNETPVVVLALSMAS